ncbi:MAG: hypothetical protein K0S28_1703 [Paucimonas sp.]|nr:hypothetical protein [Paucimonas sp.]
MKSLNGSNRGITYQHELHVARHEKDLCSYAAAHVAACVATRHMVIAIFPKAVLEYLDDYLEREIPYFRATSFQAIQYLSLEADQICAEFMRNDWPDEIEFAKSVGGLAKRAICAARQSKVVISNGLGMSLALAGKMEAAVRAEELWIELLQHYPIDVHCFYTQEVFSASKSENLLSRLCSLHETQQFGAMHLQQQELKSA